MYHPKISELFARKFNRKYAVFLLYKFCSTHSAIFMMFSWMDVPYRVCTSSESMKVQHILTVILALHLCLANTQLYTI